MNTLRIETLKELRIEAALMENTGVVSALDELIAIREMKGDQVPDGYIFQHPSGKLFWSIVSDSCANGKGVVPYYLTAPQKPVWLDADIIRDANRYRFLRDEDAWGEDSDSWDFESRTGLISWENLCEVRTGDFDAAVDARMAASDIPFLKPATATQKPVVLPHGYKPYLVRSQTTATRAAMTSGGEWLHRDEVTAAIEDAGGVVKDGE